MLINYAKTGSVMVDKDNIGNNISSIVYDNSYYDTSIINNRYDTSIRRNSFKGRKIFDHFLLVLVS